jgi:AraC family transcriptional regulator, positive regulator of tynA and feaB
MSVAVDATGRVAVGTTWSTEGLAEAEQFASWADISCEAFCPVTVTRAEDGPFASAVAGRPIGPLSVSVIASQSQRVHRTAEQVRREAGDTFFLNLPLTAGTHASQDGRTASLQAGDFTIVDSARPFRLGFDADFAQISVAVPHELLADRLADPAAATAVRVQGAGGLGAVASAAVRAAAELPALDRSAAHALADQLCSLVALAIGGVRARTSAGARELLAQAARDEIERSLHDPALSPARVAERLAISARYLHALFADQGTTFGRWLLQRRLSRSRDQLCDPAQRHRTVADIAYANGFADPSYFARAFRARYGATPRQLRPQS